jgi:hypothetical protein
MTWEEMQKGEEKEKIKERAVGRWAEIKRTTAGIRRRYKRNVTAK